LHQKRIENRGWKPPAFIVGHYIALHAAQSWDEADREWIVRATGLEVPGKKDSPHSEIFAVCRCVGFAESADDERIIPEQRKWFIGPYGWLLRDFVALVEPVRCIGGRGLWSFDSRPTELAALRLSYRRSAEGMRHVGTSRKVA
jgi:hypothetical protein